MKFGRLTVLREEKVPEGPKFRTHYVCICDCGNEMRARKGHIESGITSSCGCLQRERASESSYVHGYSHREEFGAYKLMISRCTNPDYDSYSYYGGRGITVCDRWLESFGNFIEDMGERPGPGYTIERIDNNSNYGPENCKWATRKEQGRNRCSTRLITLNDKTQCVSDWAADMKISRNALSGFLRGKPYTGDSLSSVYEARKPES